MCVRVRACVAACLLRVHAGACYVWMGCRFDTVHVALMCPWLLLLVLLLLLLLLLSGLSVYCLCIGCMVMCVRVTVLHVALFVGGWGGLNLPPKGGGLNLPPKGGGVPKRGIRLQHHPNPLSNHVHFT